MQKVSVYFNNKASNASGVDWEVGIQRYLFRSRVIFHRPCDVKALTEQIESDLREGVDAIISVGGDGTVNTLIQKLALTDVGLLVIPGGTANDFARELGACTKMGKVISPLRGQKVRHIDLIKINGRYMATNGGIGLGSEVARKVNQMRGQIPVFKSLMKASGPKVYSFFVLKELLRSSLKRYPIRVEGEGFSTFECNPVGVFINNQPRLAGTFELAPQTHNDDGTFNVTILNHPRRKELFQCILRILSGEYPQDDPHFISFETKDLSLRAIDHKSLPAFFGDGEDFGFRERYDISLAPRALKVFSSLPGTRGEYASTGLENIMTPQILL